MSETEYLFIGNMEVVRKDKFDALNQRIAEFESELKASREWSSTLADAADDLRADRDELVKQLEEERAGHAVSDVDNIVRNQAEMNRLLRINELESENKALRLIAGSHSMSELRRNKILAGDKWFKYPPAPEQNERSK